MTSQEIDFNITIKQLDTKEEEGKVLTGSTPKLIGDILLNPSFKESTPIRKLILAQEIAKEEKVVLDRERFNLVVKAIEQSGSMVTPLVQGHLLLALSKISWG